MDVGNLQFLGLHIMDNKGMGNSGLQHVAASLAFAPTKRHAYDFNHGACTCGNDNCFVLSKYGDEPL